MADPSAPASTDVDALTGKPTTGHEWDGIRELNTPLPSWWLYTFYATILFALVWVVLYPSLPYVRGITGWTARGAIGQAIEAERQRTEPMLARIRAATPAAIAADPALRTFALAGGRVAFANNCAPCHGAGGQGAPGGFPSLADDDWLFGGGFDDIEFTIRHGVRNGEDADARGVAMPAFLSSGLSQAEIADLAAFVLKLSASTADAAAAQRGAPLYEENCAVCHGANGEGNREMGAPRLDDRIWLYGGDKASIMHTIAFSRAGVMPAFAGRLDAATINMLTVYVHALGGGE
ncbi:MAG: cytochrome-c oxidase, cbb3-type subunit III [Acetobacteraceae bacterium]|nr:cytochrome-c oxidase, cbb3-type subunit III [Acetobacteraceae bacterium]